MIRIKGNKNVFEIFILLLLRMDSCCLVEFFFSTSWETKKLSYFMHNLLI